MYFNQLLEDIKELKEVIAAKDKEIVDLIEQIDLLECEINDLNDRGE